MDYFDYINNYCQSQKFVYDVNDNNSEIIYLIMINVFSIYIIIYLQYKLLLYKKYIQF